MESHSKTYLAFFIILFIIYNAHGQSAKSECDGVTCPEQLECRYPRTKVVLPDPLNKKCCHITECICEGTGSRLSTSHNTQSQYNTLLRRYTNCTMVDGNLEIVGLSIQSNKKDDYQIIDATKHIRSVTGYVLIALNHVNYIDLSSLRLIRGKTLYDENMSNKQVCGQPIPEDKNKKQFALYITGNQFESNKSVGLKEIYMPNLAEIMKGHVKIRENRDLCYIDSVLWKGEIFNLGSQAVEITNTGGPTCGQCSLACITEGVDDEPHCWGSGEEMCQKFTRIPCKDTCSQSQRCSQPLVQGKTNRRCCESYCAAGCTITGECHACVAYNNFGTCEPRCPTGAIPGDVVTAVDKEKVRYELFLFCVKKCPSTRRILESEKKCVLTCPLDYYEEGGLCKPCPEGGCSNICYGLEAKLGPLKNDDAIHSGNVGNFTKNCTIIEGSLTFRKSSFDGDDHCQIDPISNDSVYDVFENVEVITGFLNIEYWPYKDLCVFRNLKQIRGLEKRRDAYSLVILTNGKKLKNLCFNSLEEIESGRAYIAGNSRLCNVNIVNWERFFKWPGQSIVTQSNAKTKRCLPCDDACNETNGCWGPGSNQCVTCRNFTDYTDSDGKLPGKWVTDPVTQKSVPGHNVTNCVEICDFEKGVYATVDKKCFPCHDECNFTCTGPGPQDCSPSNGKHSCVNVYHVDSCIPECPISHYMDADKICQPCSPNCIGGCDGPEDAYVKDGCSTCHAKYKADEGLIIYQGPTCQICVAKFKDRDCTGCSYKNATGEYSCISETSVALYVLIPVMCIVVVLVAAIFIIWFKCKKTVRSMRKHIEEKIIGDGGQMTDDFDSPHTPSGTAPNRAQLRMVKENELTLGKELGSGAFGSVYKGVWTSMHIEGQNIKIPVAVKKLKTFSHSSEIMDEAYVMASVDSPYLMRLLGMCMTEQVSLITQLMPLGNLLEYVRGNTENINSRQMLTWCTQIAKGMQYLEDKHLVHRDLAARNVLVKTPHHIKITDFGLSKMLSATQSVYLAEGGKLPIKWLAMECINERKFSHQSDVWAFGITCWEIFTYGARPYDGVRAVDVLSLLERGERLVQPSVCTIEVYMLLVKCWLVDPLSRPRFFELVDEFSEMCHDHTRYLVVQNDVSPGIMSPNPEDEKRFFERLIREDNNDVDGELMVDDPDLYLLSHANNVEHEYENQPALDQPQGAHSGPSGSNGHGTRLFSRNTPSAQLPTPPAVTTTMDPLMEIPSSNPRVSDSSSPDDVFANSGQGLRHPSGSTKAMTVELPTPEKGAESRPVRFRPAQNSSLWSPGRKDSEENSRYTEDPTTHNRSSTYIDPTSPMSTVDHEIVSTMDVTDSMAYDEEDYLLPTPRQPTSTDYFDPSKTYPNDPAETESKSKPRPKTSNDFTPSVSNTTYIESNEMPPSHPSSWSNHLVNKPHHGQDAEYVNSAQEHEYLNWNGARNDAMMSDVMTENDGLNQPLLQHNSTSSPVATRSDEVTYFNNEEYMTTDSGIGEDNHSVMSASNSMNRSHGAQQRQPSRNRQNSSLSSGGSSSNGSIGPLVNNSTSPVHRARLSSDEQQMDMSGVVKFKPVPKPRTQSKKQPKHIEPDTSYSLDNPEYMMLQESVSDSKALLNEDA